MLQKYCLEEWGRTLFKSSNLRMEPQWQWRAEGLLSGDVAKRNLPTGLIEDISSQRMN